MTYLFPHDLPDYLPLRELAQEWGISFPVLRRLAARRRVPTYKALGRIEIYIRRADVATLQGNGIVPLDPELEEE